MSGLSKVEMSALLLLAPENLKRPSSAPPPLWVA